MAVNRKTTARLILESPVTAADTVVTARTRVNGMLRPVARVTGTFGFVVLLLVFGWAKERRARRAAVELGEAGAGGPAGRGGR